MIENGVDIVKISRISQLAEKPRFLEKYFTENEIKYIKSKLNQAETIAGIYSAKESLLKALKIGIGAGIELKDICVCHSDSGAPFVEITPKIDFYLSKLGCNSISISISHDDDFAISFCILS